MIGPDIVLWGCHLSYKVGEVGRKVPWHQDGQFCPFRLLASCILRLVLDEVSRENRCMRVIPGSHADETLYRHYEDKTPP